MWIKDQKGTEIYNLDNIVKIFISRVKTIGDECKVCCTTDNGSVFTLGEYRDTDAALKVLNIIFKNVNGQINYDEIVPLELPLGGEV